MCSTCSFQGNVNTDMEDWKELMVVIENAFSRESHTPVATIQLKVAGL